MVLVAAVPVGPAVTVGRFAAGLRDDLAADQAQQFGDGDVIRSGSLSMTWQAAAVTAR
jgi:hypothetical protein